MLNLSSASFPCVFLLLITYAFAVTIEISPVPVNPSTLYLIQSCSNIPPGHCCKPRREPPNPDNLEGSGESSPPPTRQNRPTFSGVPAALPNKRITFTGLEPRDLASVFTGYGDEPGCRGRPKATYNGGGRWVYDVDADEEESVIEGGSWIRMPLGYPEEADSGWVEAEGVIGLIGQSQNWFGSSTSQTARSRLLDVANAQLAQGRGGSGHPLGWKVKRIGKRVIDWSKLITGIDRTLEKRTFRTPYHGMAFCVAPKRSVPPDVMVLNGEEYTLEVPQGSVYVGAGGKVLNYTETAT
ncbi:MAG: hypothetical protein Q9205_001164 [Flavoplaca limonia]